MKIVWLAFFKTAFSSATTNVFKFEYEDAHSWYITCNGIGTHFRDYKLQKNDKIFFRKEFLAIKNLWITMKVLWLVFKPFQKIPNWVKIIIFLSNYKQAISKKNDFFCL